MQSGQQKIPSKLIYYRTPISFDLASLRDHKLRNRNFSRHISCFPTGIPKKTLSHYLGKATRYAEVYESDLVSFRSLNYKNLKTARITGPDITRPRRKMDHSFYNPKTLSKSLFLFNNLQSLHLERPLYNYELRALRFFSQLKRLRFAFLRNVLWDDLDWTPRFKLLENLELGIKRFPSDYHSFPTSTFKIFLHNLIKFFSLPKLQHISFQSEFRFERLQFEEMLKILPDLRSFKIQADLNDKPFFEEERIQDILSQVDYLEFWILFDFSDDKLNSEGLIGKTHNELLKKSKKTLILRLHYVEADLCFLTFMTNLKALSFASRELVLSMKIDPSFRCPDHVRSITFMCLPEHKSAEVIPYLIQFLSSVPQLDNFTFEGSVSSEEDLLQFIELLKLDCFKSLKTLFIDIKFEEWNNEKLLNQLWTQLSHLQNLKNFGLRIIKTASFSLQALADSLRSLSELEYLSLHKQERLGYEPQSLLDFIVPFDALPNLSYFCLYLSHDYLSPNSKTNFKEVVKLKNLQVFEIIDAWKDKTSESCKLFHKIKSMNGSQRVQINEFDYRKSTYKDKDDHPWYF